MVVAVDGPDAAGKTTLADRLALLLTRPVVRASVDGFAAPPARRRARGPLSPRGCYEDGTDRDALVSRLLSPFVGGAPTVVTSVRDARTDVVGDVCVDVPAEAVLVLDGVFLLRPELRRWYDLTVWLDVAPEESLRRGVERDAALFGSASAARERYLARYLPAQELHRAACDPVGTADVVLDTTSPAVPRVVAWR